MFKKIYIEITNRCNLACTFCRPTTRPAATMPATMFAELLDRIGGHTQHLCLHVLGEPLLHPALPHLLDLAHAHELRVNLTTNGALLGRHEQDLLAAPALRQISISLHSLSQMEADAAEIALETMLRFSCQAGATGRLWISLRLWNLTEGMDGATRVWNDRILARLGEVFSLPDLHAVDLTACRGIALAPRVFLNPEHRFAWPDPLAPEIATHGHCRGLRDHLAILVDGTVVPCCLDGDGVLALGNLLDTPLTDILTSHRARRMSAGFGHQRLIEPLCRRCSYRLRFSAER